MWLSAIKLAVSAGSKIYANKQKTKMAMSDAQLMHASRMAEGKEAYQGKLLEARQSDWKDEAVLIILSLPIAILAWAVVSEDPTAMDKVKLFFDMFSQLPSWFTNLWILVVASIYGIKGTQIFKNGGKKIMSKKSRKRNKKILGLLGALGAGLAMANRKPKQSSVSVESGRDSGLRPTVDDMEFKETVVSTPIAKPVVKSVPVGRMRGTGSDESAIAGQNKRAAYAQSMRAPKNVMGPFDYMQPRRSSIMAKPGLNRMSDDMGFKKGGRVGCGKAKRGFGRAMKGKK